MSDRENLSDLMQRFVDDRDALSEHEYARLVEAIRQQPELIGQLRDQLRVDDALSQALALDRRNFDAQVQQRIADHLRGEDELNRQAEELRSIALARIELEQGHTRWNWPSLVGLALALSLFAAAGVGLWLWQRSQSQSRLARVESVQGQVVVRRVPRDQDRYAEPGMPLRLGDGVLVGDKATIAIAWPDGTRVELQSGAQAELPSTTSGKRVYLDEGELAASVAAQPSRHPMRFKTPHAEAVVRGTELFLRVTPDETRLEVAKGKVELVEQETSDSQLVATAQSAIARTGEEVIKQAVRMPTSQRGLVYLFTPNQRLFLRGSKLERTRIEPRAGASFTESGTMQLRGGWMTDTTAAADVGGRLEDSGQFTLEAVLEFPTTASQEDRTIFGIEGDQGPLLALVQRRNSLELAFFADQGEPQRITVASLDAPEAKLHLTVVYDGGQIRAYVGGKEAGAAVRVARPLAIGGASRLVFGGNENESTRWSGKIQGLATYNRALSAAEIRGNAP